MRPAGRLDFGPRMCVCNMGAIPCKQILNTVHDGNGYMEGVCLGFWGQSMALDERLREKPDFWRNLEQWQIGDYREPTLRGLGMAFARFGYNEIRNEDVVLRSL